MTANTDTNNIGDCLERLRDLINVSIDTVKQDQVLHSDPPLDLDPRRRHPLRDRYSQDVARALRCLSSAGLMLRALCDPEARLHDIMFNFADLTALFVACQADIANVLGDQALDAAAIEQSTGIEADKMSRHLRALCNMHIFQEVAPDVFQNNEISLLLQSESRRALVGLCAEESRLAACKMWEALNRPDYKRSKSVNKAAFNIAYKTDLNIFQYWEQVRPDLGERGSRAFAGKGLNEQQYLALYPWAEESAGTLVVDVGGGVGGATLPIVSRFEHLKLQVQDMTGNENKFWKHLHANHPELAASDRVSFQGQDFFQENTTPHAPIYFLRHVLHDWPDAEATTLLSRLAAAMLPLSKILICEHMVLSTYSESPASKDSSNDVADNEAREQWKAPSPLLPNWGAGFTSRLDLHVLSCINSRQRTEEDFRMLADGAGLKVAAVRRNMGDEVLVECVLK